MLHNAMIVLTILMLASLVATGLCLYFGKKLYEYRLKNGTVNRDLSIK